MRVRTLVNLSRAAKPQFCGTILPTLNQRTLIKGGVVRYKGRAKWLEAPNVEYGRNGNQHVYVRHPQVSGSAFHISRRWTSGPDTFPIAELCPRPVSTSWCLLAQFVSSSLEAPGDGSCFASSSWAPRQAAGFRSGIADVWCAGKHERPNELRSTRPIEVKPTGAMVSDQRLARPASAGDRDAAAAPQSRTTQA